MYAVCFIHNTSIPIQHIKVNTYDRIQVDRMPVMISNILVKNYS